MARVDSRPMGPSRTKTSPVPVPRTRRLLENRILTSFQPGLAVPVYAQALLREDQATRIDLRLTLTQAETVELLVNAVNFRALAYLVPFTAFDRFNGMDQFNRSYSKEPEIDGGAVTPFITAAPFIKASNKILTTLGIHARENQSINMAYVEAYNEIFNFRCRNRSPDLVPRGTLDVTLAPAFWNHQQWLNTVPDFDQAAIEGEVPLTVVSGALPVKGLGIRVPGTAAANNVYETGATATRSMTGWIANPSGTVTAGQAQLIAEQGPGAGSFPKIYAEMVENGITVSLANIEMARKTQAFALLRKQYNGLEDDYIMDLLMSGITVPDQDLRQPILLADRSTVVGMAKRYASDSLDLTASVTNGGTFLDLRMRTPRVQTGGIIMVVVEVVPEQLFERQADPFMTTLDQDLYPEFIRDTLDPEKVDVVKNEEVDIHHTTPTNTFGYSFMNGKWARSIPRVGGKFYRPNPDGGFDQDRQRIWAVETLNPTLSRDFYLCGTVNRKPFVDQVSDAYEIVIRGNTQISGNTVFGRPLIEASDDYSEIMDMAPGSPQIPKTLSGAESAVEAGLETGEEKVDGTEAG